LPPPKVSKKPVPNVDKFAPVQVALPPQNETSEASRTPPTEIS